MASTVTTTNSTSATGADLLLDALIEEEATHFFNIPGLGSSGLVDSLVGRPLDYVMALHEGGLVSIADGFARASGRATFTSVYMMPGTANLMSAMYIARQDRTPLVVTATQQQRSLVGRDPYASIDEFLTMAGSVAKWSHEVNAPERLPEAIHRAFAVAMTPPRGPVFLAIPYELFPAVADGPLSGPSRRSAVPGLGGLDPTVCDALVDMLVSAERPALVVGKDVVERRAVAQIIALAERVGAPVLHEEWTMVVAFPNRHPLSLGNATEAGAPKLLERLGTDFLLHIGARVFPEVAGPLGDLPSGMAVAAIGETAGDLGRRCALEVASIADVGIATEQLLAAYPTTGYDEKRDRRLDVATEVREEQEESRNATASPSVDDSSRIDPRALFQEVNKVITPDTLVVEHTTTNIAHFQAELDVVRPENFFGTGSSVQGWGLPASIGIQMARPEERVLAIVGDGGFCFTPQALWTAARRNVPVTVVVLNNRGYRATRGGLKHPRITEADMREEYDFWFDVDLLSIAKGFGVDGIRVSNVLDLGDAIREGLAADGPTVIDAVVAE